MASANKNHVVKLSLTLFMALLVFGWSYSPMSSARWVKHYDKEQGEIVSEWRSDGNAKSPGKSINSQAKGKKQSAYEREWAAMNKEERSKVLKPFSSLSVASATCASCHKKENPGLYQQWGHSKHFGANVGCYECHKADPSDPDAIRHKDFVIAVIVSPKDCGQCHETEAKQFAKSHHSKAAEIIGSLDNVLGEVVEGMMSFHGVSPVTVTGCWQCHGTEVKILPNGDLDPVSWPNTGIGRINPDGSRGACSACHQRHEFSAAQARRPENCGKCHLGPDHPQKEIYDESKHGINFYANVDKMNLDSAKWIPGEDYDAAPTCATCHMSATRNLPITHDVGDRLTWTLRPPISERIDARDAKMGNNKKPWRERRKDMQDVCESCHSYKLVNNFYEQFDGLVEMYNNKYAIPTTEMMHLLLDEGLRTETPFDENIEWTYFFLWHHEGRRARHGASMQAPDYVQWHGMYEVAHRFYAEWVPEIREIIEKAELKGNHEGAKKAAKLLDTILHQEGHAWFIGATPPALAAKRKAQREEFNKRYLQEIR